MPLAVSTLGVVAAAVALVVTVGRRPVRARLVVHAGDVRLEVPGPEAVAMLVRRARMPLSAVTGARVASLDEVGVHGLRVGTAAPPWVLAGRFRRRRGWDLVDVRRGGQVLEVSFAPGGAWLRWVLELPDPLAALRLLQASTA